MKSVAKILFLLFAVIGWEGCIKKDKFSDVPGITFKQFLLNPNTLKGELTFNFTDGDGNIGFRQEDTVPPYHRGGDHYYNLYMDYMVKIDGEFIKKEPRVPYYYRLPYIQPEGKNKSLQGTITVRDITPFPITLDYDTVRFMFYMEDREFNKSNVVMTNDIIRP